MKKLVSLVLAVWIIKYNVLVDKGNVLCSDGETVQISTNVFQHPLCISFSVSEAVWKDTYKRKSDAEAAAKILVEKNGFKNVQIEREVNPAVLPSPR